MSEPASYSFDLNRGGRSYDRRYEDGGGLGGWVPRQFLDDKDPYPNTCPVLGEYAERLFSCVPDDYCEELLKPLLPLFSGTDGRNARRRKHATFLTRWTTTKIVPMALDAVGLTRDAKRYRLAGRYFNSIRAGKIAERLLAEARGRDTYTGAPSAQIKDTAEEALQERRTAAASAAEKVASALLALDAAKEVASEDPFERDIIDAHRSNNGSLEELVAMVDDWDAHALARDVDHWIDAVTWAQEALSEAANAVDPQDRRKLFEVAVDGLRRAMLLGANPQFDWQRPLVIIKATIGLARSVAMSAGRAMIGYGMGRSRVVTK